MNNIQTVSDLQIITSEAENGSYETFISAEFGNIAYGRGTAKESETNALNQLYEHRRLTLMAFCSGLGRYLSLADICQRAQLPTSAVKYQVKKLLENGRIVEHEQGGSYKPRWDV